MRLSRLCSTAFLRLGLLLASAGIYLLFFLAFPAQTRLHWEMDTIARRQQTRAGLVLGSERRSAPVAETVDSLASSSSSSSSSETPTPMHTVISFFGDPQMEGHTRILREGWYGWLAVQMNDLYMRHITASVARYVRPTLVFVLGDLFSFQWLPDDEYAKRVQRYNWIFSPLTSGRRSSHVGDASSTTRTLVQNDDDGGAAYLVNISGNHDVGYANELLPFQMQRFVDTFGNPNVILTDDEEQAKVDSEDDKGAAKKEESRHRGHLAKSLANAAASYHQRSGLAPPGHIVATFNSMNMDGPARDEKLRDSTWAHIRRIAEVRRERNQPLILIMHIPLHKPEGSCYDAPLMLHEGGRLAKQHMLSPNATDYILRELQPTLVFNGHDHEGCEYVHRTLVNDRQTVSRRGAVAERSGEPALLVAHEYTIRSVMGDYGGLSAALGIVSASRDGPHEYVFFSERFVVMQFITVYLVLCAVWSALFVAGMLATLFRRKSS